MDHLSFFYVLFCFRISILDIDDLIMDDWDSSVLAKAIWSFELNQSLSLSVVIFQLEVSIVVLKICS